MSYSIPAVILAINRSDVFPCRSLLSFRDGTILSSVFSRLSKVRHVSKVVLCTSTDKYDDSLVELAQQIGLKVLRGEKDNLLKRLELAFDALGAENIVVARGDTPFISVRYCEKLITNHFAHNAQYSYSDHLLGLPYGLGCEVIARSAIEQMLELSVEDTFSQQYGVFIRLHHEKIKIYRMDFKRPEPSMRFVVETQQDYEFAVELSKLAPETADTEELIEILKKHQFLQKINILKNTVQEVGISKLALFPEKLYRLINTDFDESYPVSVELSLTNACNLCCTWCSDASLRKMRPGEIPFKNYQALVSDLANHGTKGLVLEGGGEPTIYPMFKQALEFALDQGMAVGLITNGVVINYLDFLPRIEWVRVSLDSDNPETFKRIKGHDYFYKVLSNIKKLCENKENCVVGVGYVVSRDNLQNLEEITILLKEYGVNYLHLRPVIDHPELAIEHDLFYLKKHETEHFSIMIQAMQENKDAGNCGSPCFAHSLSSVICADGSVFLCGRLNIHPWHEPIGNININSFHEIWLGEKRRVQSKQVRESLFCRQWCPQCRLTKYNLIINSAIKIKTRNFI